MLVHGKVLEKRIDLGGKKLCGKVKEKRIGLGGKKFSVCVKFKICVGLLAFFYVNVVKFQNFKFEWFC